MRGWISLNSHTAGVVSRKIYKPVPLAKDATELHRSISFNIALARISDPSAPVAQDVQTPEVSSTLVESVTVPTQVKRGDLQVVSREVIEGSRLKVEEIELAPWQPLLTKVERFNGLMAGITEVGIVTCRTRAVC